MKKIAFLMVIIILISVFSGCTILDSNSSTSSDFADKLDSDNDGVPDKIDAFPFDPAASVDSDDDGSPDEWNPGKSQSDSTTDLILDDFLKDPAASVDTDKDGYPDRWNSGKNQGESTSIPPLELDEFPNDPKAHKDTDGDGVADYYDIHDFANLTIEISIQKFQVTGWVDPFIRAQVYFGIYINGERLKIIDNNGNKWRVWINQVKEISHEPIIVDIPDDTKEQFTDIEIIMYDYDIFDKNDVIDISDKSGETTLVLRFDNVANTITYDGVSRGSKGIVWYDLTFPDSDIPEIDKYDRTYRWNFNNKQWIFSMEILKSVYQAYIDYKIDRSPNTYDVMTRYVTPDDKVITELSEELKSFAEGENYNMVTTANFILRFVQVNIMYGLDNKTKNCIEYWRFPVESLVEKRGDCEDSSVLFASIMEALNFDVALLFYTWEENGQSIGHLAVGLHLDGDHGSYVKDNTGKKYYYCETTTPSYVVGKLPPDMEDKTGKIIHI